MSNPIHLNPPATIRSAGRGFSLLELVLVIVVIGTMAGIALPRMAASNQHARAEQVLDRIERLYSKAQTMAMTRSAMTELVVLKTNETIRIRFGGSIVETIDLTRSPYKADITHFNLGGNNRILFDGFGRPDSDGNVTIQVGSIKRNIVFGTTPVVNWSVRSSGLTRTPAFEGGINNIKSNPGLGSLGDSKASDSLIGGAQK